MNSVQCVQVQVQMNLQVQVHCIMYTVQCVGCSVLPAKNEDVAVETGLVKSKFYLLKLRLKN